MIEQQLSAAVRAAIEALYNHTVAPEQTALQKTKKEFEGHLTLVVFPFLRISRKSPEETAREIGQYLREHEPAVADFNVIKGFLNLTIAGSRWVEALGAIHADDAFGTRPITAESPLVMVEYSSPNTNKPLHLGHVRNNLLGYSLSRILEANGNRVVKTNIVNDRGIHICKSMLAWKKWGEGATPESTGKKGDHLVGDFYVLFDKHYREELRTLEATGLTREEAEEEAVRMVNVYADFARDFLAIPVHVGVKSANERFAGAVETYTIEALMQDGKALQSGTSHFLGQNFAKAFDVTFTNKDGQQELVWATSWGVSTRLMGALIMSHSDDNGLVLPPTLAPHQVVIVPIYKTLEQRDEIGRHVEPLIAELKKRGIRVRYDDADNKKPGWKFAEYELKGVPVRLALGGRDLENGTVEVARRDTLTKETCAFDGIADHIAQLLDEIQQNIYQKALDYRESHTITVDTYEEFKEKIEEGGFILAHWDGTPETEEKIKAETKATIRCIPLEGDKTPGKCMVTGKPSAQRVLFARAY